jgi:hypothetical protein
MLTEGLIPTPKKNINRFILRTEGLMPIPERSYIRTIYLGKLVLRHKASECSKKGTPTLEEMMREIWEKASIYNRENFISGHLACSKSLHVVQLLEGEEQIVNSLMERIRKDPRVTIKMEFKKKLKTMHLGWQLSMCYSFEITSTERQLIQNEKISLEKMVDMMRNTYQVRQENLDVTAFYKHIIECILLKYISSTGDEAIFDNQECGMIEGFCDFCVLL